MKKLFILIAIFSLAINNDFAQKVEISGHVLGPDNKPLTNASLNYFDTGLKESIPVKIGEDGSFKFKTGQNCLYLLFSDVNNRTVNLPLVINKFRKISFDITLDRMGAKINPKNPGLSEIRIFDESIKAQEYSDILRNKAQSDTTFGKDLQEFAIYIKEKLKDEKDKIVRSYYYIRYLKYFSGLHITHYNDKALKVIDSSLFVNALKEINPASILWRALSPDLIYNIQGPFYSYNRQQYRDYLDKVIKMNKAAEVVANCLWVKAEYLKNDIKDRLEKMKQERENPPLSSLSKDSALTWYNNLVEDYKRKNNLNEEQIKDSSRAISALFGAVLKRKLEERKNQLNIQYSEAKASVFDFSEAEKISRQCLDRLVKEFPNSDKGRLVINDYFTIRRDDPVPDYELASIDEKNKNYTDASMKGKCYLLDFWASWCLPCVWKIPELNEVHEKLKGYNFEILSISLDDSDEDVAEFRKLNPMPWLHTRLPKGFDDEIAKRFGVLGIPKLLLISTDGRVLANDAELRGPYFAEKVIKIVKGEN
ncbi:MAG: TlpA family protein disulfide reductase [Acidobacteriota bacterium]